MKNIVQIAALIILTIVPTFGADVNTAAQNAVDVNNTIQTKILQKSDETAKIQQENERLKTENAVAEKAIKVYEESVNNLKWGLWGMVALVIVSVGILVFESTREYKEALRDTKEAAKEAEKAAEKARDWETKAQKTFNEIDTTVKKKLDEIKEKTDKIIEAKANEAFEQISKKAEEEREKAQKGAEQKKQVSERWARSLEDVLMGNTIAEQAQKKEEVNRTHRQVGAKVRQTIKELGGIMPENLPAAEDIKKLETKQKKALKGKDILQDIAE